MGPAHGRYEAAVIPVAGSTCPPVIALGGRHNPYHFPHTGESVTGGAQYMRAVATMGTGLMEHVAIGVRMLTWAFPAPALLAAGIGRQKRII